MWISSYKWEQMCRRIDRCEKRITMQQEMMEQKIIEMSCSITCPPHK